jgi:membrane-bound serine protease (ClpP class)
MTDRTKQIRGRIARTLVAAGLLLLALAGSAQAASPRVTVLTASGAVDNVMAGYLGDGIAAAERDGVSAVVIELDTPGGSLGAMQDITTAMLESTVPVIVWVAPAGGWAASAGTFITLAGNLAYMAPGTSIGAASPVDANGGDIPGTEGTKVMNISISTITSIAQTRGRDPSWPVSAVRDATSASAAEAVQLHVVDGIADTLDSVLGQATGHQVTTRAGTITLALAGAAVSTAPMNPVEGLLHLLSDPNIAFVLFVLGLAALVIELFHQTILAGVAGVLALILAFVGFGSLPLNFAGLLLVAFGMLLFALETQITSHGLLGLGGVVAFVLGASVLYSPGPGDTANLVHVALPVIIVMAAAMLALVVAIAWAARRIRRMAPPRDTVGTALPVGTPGIVQMPLAPLGTVHLGGETWSARTVDGRQLDRGTTVSLVAFDRLVAVVAAAAPAAATVGQPGLSTTPASAIPPAAGS